MRADGPNLWLSECIVSTAVDFSPVSSLRATDRDIVCLPNRHTGSAGSSTADVVLARGRRHGRFCCGRPPMASCSDALRPYRHLAVRVIDQALRDLASPVGSTSDRESARAFLAGSPGLYLWCELAALDPQWVVIRLKNLFPHWGRTPGGAQSGGPAPTPKNGPGR
jgi:hypothetical protein